MKREPVRIEGYNPEDLLYLLDDQWEQVVFSGRPIAFRIGSARLLGQFAIGPDTLLIELAQIDGGGEGVLPALASLAKRFARKRGLGAIEWFVYATHCARPNLRLRRMLEHRGFTVWEISGRGECYYRRTPTTEAARGLERSAESAAHHAIRQEKM